MAIFLPLDVGKRAAAEGITDRDWCYAISRADRGQIDAQLGLALIKLRLPRLGQGRSRGFRAIVAHERGGIAVPLHLYAKNAKANLTKIETEEYRALARYLMRLSEEEFTRLASQRGWRRIDNELSEADV